MLRSNYVLAAALLLSATSVMAQTTRPTETPQVTVSADTKLLIFDWKPVPGATYYQLYVNVDGHSGFTKTGAQVPAPGTRAGYGISAHLQHWQDALFRLSACNAAGCRDSKSLFPRRHMLETIGYFKASNTDPHDNFGSDVVVSGDGSTMAVNASNEASNATGINGNQSNNSLNEAGAVYVFRKVSGHWRQEAYIKSAVSHALRHFGVASDPGAHALALNNDGSLLVVGAPDGADTSQSAVTTYVRASNGAWSLQSTLQAPAGQDNDSFGSSVDVSGDGNTLHVQGAVNRENGDSAPRSFLFTRSTSGSWVYRQSIPAPDEFEFCNSGRLSGDGSTVIRLCPGEEVNSAQIVTYKRSGSTWNLVQALQFSGTSMELAAISNDASRLAVWEPWRGSVTASVHRWENGGWVEEGHLQETFDVADDPASEFGRSLSLNGNGSLLAIGDSGANPPAPPGISEQAPAGAATHSGTVFIFQRQVAGTSVTWNLRSQVMAPNPDEGDGFGSSVSLSATGSTLAVGAVGESSKSKGINGDQTDDSATDAGAAYLY